MGMETKPVMLQFGWENIDSLTRYLVIHGWSEVKKRLFCLEANGWKVTANVQDFPVAHIAIHNPKDEVEGHCSFNFLLPMQQEYFASEVEFWRKIANPELREFLQ